MTILSNSLPQEVATNCGIHVERQEFPPGEKPTKQKDGDAKQFYDMLSNYGTKPVSAQSFAVGAPKEEDGLLGFFLSPWTRMKYDGMDEFDTLFKDIGYHRVPMDTYTVFGFVQFFVKLGSKNWMMGKITGKPYIWW